MSHPRKKVVCAMSGGVDSSVAAALLQQQGYEVLGVFMRLGSPDGVDPEIGEPASAGGSCETGKSKQGCCSVLDAVDASRVAGVLGIPLYVLNFQDDFSKVIDYFVSEYNKGRTPNPCVRCNDWLKFGKLAKYAQAVGADYVASGHYARIGTDPQTGTRALCRGLDLSKDQSYVLFGMSQETLAHTLLPIGEFQKSRVREIAQELNLPVYNKPDSQEICFVPNQDYAALVQRRTPEAFKEGELVDTTGKTLGHHPGHQHFTIGQRKRVGVALGHPVYVVDINPQTNRVTIGEKESLLKQSLVAHQINLLTSRWGFSPSPCTQGEGSSSPTPVRCQAKIRYNHQPQPATAILTGSDELTVTFDTPQPAITPGQAVVLYDNDILLAGGWID
ncbi:MAG TPA: tRNA 2-thiouridine(34) synthase MnmA, partial [Tepidisphaeraceae bacterium]|jgi:tRNA-specific 2-thiouridylase|nr:tRNA 2-thiouridine(34) synthase MnmA [Tepidisphaeraceae bacterium]